MGVLLPVLAAVAAWYVGTGAVVLANRRPASTYVVTLSLSLLLVGAAVAGIEATVDLTTASAAYVAFVAAVVLWGWLEMSYLMGVVTGPEKGPCPPELSGWQRFRRGVNVSLYHELTVIGVGVGVILLCWNAPNTVAAWTFGTLWLMRWSAKLNLFLGVANMDLELLPAHMRYLGSYMARRPMNPLFPVSVTAGAIACVVHLLAVFEPGAGEFERVAWALVGTITGLAVLEHALLVLPLRDSRLWRWAVQ
ncbi:MAG: putative photosynthetic complex assembly protein PuhE [Pseudomonadales bacterium]